MTYRLELNAADLKGQRIQITYNGHEDEWAVKQRAYDALIAGGWIDDNKIIDTVERAWRRNHPSKIRVHV